jgi:hypothetical protein
MKLNQILATLALSSLLAAPLSGFAQETHREAVRSQRRHDHRHHTGAKIVGGSAAGGAVIGAMAGGGKGALIGGAIGAGGGAIANKVRVDKGVKARERNGPPQR